MKTSSRKAKGRALQNSLRDCLKDTFPELEADDIKPALMGESGEDIKLSPAARKLIPWSFECKNVESLNIWAALDQAEKNASKGKPALVFKRNRTKPYVAVRLEDFMELIRGKKIV